MATAKIFGLGFPKTGTTTLEKAHKILGYTVCEGNWRNHYTNYLHGLYVNGDIDGLLRVTRHFDAFFDAPWGGSDMYRHIIAAYPNAKFILSVRDTESWFKSLSRQIENPETTVTEAFHARGAFGVARFYEEVFGVTDWTDDPDGIRAYYEQTNQNVRAHLANNGCDFIEIDVAQGEGWEKLCPFLGVPYPEVAFPHANPGRSGTDQAQTQSLSLGQALEQAYAAYSKGQTQKAHTLCQKILAVAPQNHQAIILDRLLRSHDPV